MNKFIMDKIDEFYINKEIIDNTNQPLEEQYNVVKNEIVSCAQELYNNNDESKREELVSLFNNIYYINSQLHPDKPFSLDPELSVISDSIFVIDQQPERFEVDEGLINNIRVDEGLTMEEATALLKWTSNNTRDNLSKMLGDNAYGNNPLMGSCGFAQFSSLYPLQQLGLEVTVNNMCDQVDVSNNHAFGTVFIPIKENNEIVRKRFLVDCTYRQFFTIGDNVAVKYLLGSSPGVGFFVQQDEKDIEMAKKLLKDGFIEADDEVLKKYVEPFYKSSFEYNRLDQVDRNWSFVSEDVPAIIDEEQSEFDFSEEDSKEYGFNIIIPGHNQKRNI